MAFTGMAWGVGLSRAVLAYVVSVFLVCLLPVLFVWFGLFVFLLFNGWRDQAFIGAFKNL